MAMAPPEADKGTEQALGFFWHPVCTVGEVKKAGGVLGVRLLGVDLAIADLGAGLAALVDRCPHRSTRLSVGSVAEGALRCACHGWRWGGDGRCVEIPAAPGTPIPERFRQTAHAAEERYGLVWVRLDDRAPTTIPAMPAAEDPEMKVVAGQPYTWAVSAARRIENAVDMAHFAWVHDGTLGRRDTPVHPVPSPVRVDGELRFHFDPPPLDRQDATALVGASDYRMPMPLTVDIGFEIAGRPGVRRHLWMTASPVDSVTCRTFWTVSRTDGHDEPDDPHLAFQEVVLAEDEPVVTNQIPAWLPLTSDELAGAPELHVRADRVSIEYRRWLTDLVSAASSEDAGGSIAATLAAKVPA